MKWLPVILAGVATVCLVLALILNVSILCLPAAVLLLGHLLITVVRGPYR